MLGLICDNVSLDDFAQKSAIAARIVNTVFIQNIYTIVVSLIKNEVDQIFRCKYLTTVFN